MMQSHPISRVAWVILIKLFATAVSTVTTPLISMTKTRARLSAMRDNVFSMMSCVRCESTTPTKGSRRTPSQIDVTGVDIASMALPLSSTRRLANWAI
jgi:hypothetical protein